VRLARAGNSDTIAQLFIASFRRLTFLPTTHTDEQIRTWISRQTASAREVWIA
jgi:hypothetical protein